MLKFKIRLSTAEDLHIRVGSHLTIAQLKEIVFQQKKIPVHLQRAYLYGKLLPDKDPIGNHVKNGIFLQIFVLPTDT